MEQQFEAVTSVDCVLLMWDGDAIPPSDSGDKAFSVSGNLLFDVTLVMFGQVTVV